MKRFGDVLKELREAAGLTQRELAAKANVPVSTVCNHEQCIRNPSWAHAERYADALDVSLDVFRRTAASKQRRK